MTRAQFKRAQALRRIIDRDMKLQEAALANTCGPYCDGKASGWLAFAIGFLTGMGAAAIIWTVIA